VAVTTSLHEAVEHYAGLEQPALRDRWSLYARLREEAPAYRFGNTVLLSRYVDIAELLLDERVRNGAPSHGVPPTVRDRLTDEERTMLADIVDWEERWLTSANGARHAELRGLGTRVFAPRAIVDMRERVEAIVEGMLDQLAGTPSVEFISGFAYRLPLTVISEILDIPPEMRQPLHETWVGMMPARTGVAWRTGLPRDLAETHGHFMAMRRQLAELLARRRGTETTQIMQNIVDAHADGADELDLLVLIQILVSAGHQTTEDLLGNGMHALLTSREQWELLCADPARAANAVEEILRFRSPSQDIERFAAVDLTLHGLEIAADEHLTLVLGSANHDPAAFVEPDRFDIERDDARKHIAFGRGPHFCLGAALSRLEATVALPIIARRFPDVELLREEPDWLPTTHLLGLTSLPLALGRDRG
jgi:cytochrome P450